MRPATKIPRKVNPDLICAAREMYLASPFYHPTIWQHADAVAMLALSLSIEESGGNNIVVYLAGLLHDIGAALRGLKDHQITGAEIAGEMLREFNYSDRVIEEVKYCIRVHRGSVGGDRETFEAQCVASADGADHFLQISALFGVAFLQMELNSKEAADWVRRKLRNSWKKMLPIHQEMMRERYEAVKTLLEGSIR